MGVRDWHTCSTGFKSTRSLSSDPAVKEFSVWGLHIYAAAMDLAAQEDFFHEYYIRRRGQAPVLNVERFRTDANLAFDARFTGQVLREKADRFYVLLRAIKRGHPAYQDTTWVELHYHQKDDEEWFQCPPGPVCEYDCEWVVSDRIDQYIEYCWLERYIEWDRAALSNQDLEDIAERARQQRQRVHVEVEERQDGQMRFF